MVTDPYSVADTRFFHFAMIAFAQYCFNSTCKRLNKKLETTPKDFVPY